VSDPDRDPPAAGPGTRCRPTTPAGASGLTPEQYAVLRREATERAGSSPLNDEKRTGTFLCAGCGQPLFRSDAKYESGSGWPSFFAPLPGAIGTKRDFRLIWPRTEYHCANCGGHQGHLFDDGPPPTGQRYCNNGVALRFVPDDASAGPTACR
jgi:peptide-methionine (R)-S-oxide reductase